MSLPSVLLTSIPSILLMSLPSLLNFSSETYSLLIDTYIKDSQQCARRGSWVSWEHVQQGLRGHQAGHVALGVAHCRATDLSQ
ncbi:hypothetical protein EV702DRAFT_1084578 [Suillus placidus]|uniref:Uncharacterized protein n=1 Tax=Suillus placidus TaxID=48579 RepID=A0A9P7A078_9AGAM|nr:hypothetical protein EV702DRAFT_1084578 [Suillus placidus]